MTTTYYEDALGVTRLRKLGHHVTDDPEVAADLRRREAHAAERLANETPRQRRIRELNELEDKHGDFFMKLLRREWAATIRAGRDR